MKEPTVILEKNVVQANPLIEARKHMNLSEMRLFILGLQGIRPHIKDNTIYDRDFSETLITPSELEGLFGNTGGVNNLKRHIRKAFAGYIELTEDNGGMTLYHIYEKLTYIPGKGLLIKFDKNMKRHILEIIGQAYTSYSLKTMFPLSSEYAWRILESLLEYQGYLKKGLKRVYCELTVEELRFRLNVPEGLYEGRIDNLKSRVLDVPIKEINEKTHYHVWYDVEKEGRKVIGFKLWLEIKKTALPAPPTPSQEELLEQEAGQVRLIEAKPAKALTDKQEELVDRLVNRDVGARVARKLVKTHPAEQIESNLKYCVERRESYKDLAATLVTAISEDWAGTAQKEKQEAQERIEKRQKERRQVYDDFHGTQMAGIGKTTKAKAKKKEKKPLTELGDFDVMMIQQKGEKAGKAILDRMKKLGLTVSDVKAGKRK